MHSFNNNRKYLQDILKTAETVRSRTLAYLVSYINDLKHDFVACGKSAMDLICSEGLLVDRLFGGVGRFMEKTLEIICNFAVLILII